MRFIEQGSDIPDALIRAVNDGHATFLCGAGVSFRANLPSFKILTERVYEQLGEAPDEEAAERNAIRSKEYDRALRSLEKRTHRPGTPSRVRDAVADLLVAPDTAFPDHLALLQLSRDGDGRPRLLTTNFDTLFERAASAGTLHDVPSYAGVSMPRAGGERDHGILHLHGRIADNALHLERTDLILTSADFGDAYLRSGWASRYIEDRMRLGTLVLVGYGADDAAMRLLLETLDADRDLHDIYAIEKGTEISASIWKSKGIKPIEFDDYGPIYATLSEWARYATQPVEYRRARIRDILSTAVGGADDRFKPIKNSLADERPLKKTPADATPFEREQLRFFLSGSDIAATLSEFNPSLAWLPLLSEMKIIQSETQLIAWIERNFSEVDAVRDVVANINFFGPETANYLEFRLNAQENTLPPLLSQSWALIIRHMQATKRGLAQNEWFEIAPQLKRGDHSAALVERIGNVLRPKLKIAKRFSLYGNDDKLPVRPSDLMSIDFKVEGGMTSKDLLATWPVNATAETDEKLVLQLTVSLVGALADAADVGVESNEGYSTSDTDVPSVAQHRQNQHRSGFQSIVRVMAEVWTRLASKSPIKALAIVKSWSERSFNLMRRLAMFASTNSVVSGDLAADILIGLSARELFFTNATVEAYRLIGTRWNDFPAEKQKQLLVRICEGPPRSAFRTATDTDRYIDRSRYDMLTYMVQDGIDIGAEASEVLADIRLRWPQWQPQPSEQAGFHVWHESGFRDLGGGQTKLKDVSDGELVPEARTIAEAAGFMEGDSWQGLCLNQPDRALRGLDAAAAREDWPIDLWEQLLWSMKAYEDAETEQRIAELLLKWPESDFDKIAPAASSWLAAHRRTLSEALLWAIWDRVADATLTDAAEPEHG